MLHNRIVAPREHLGTVHQHSAQGHTILLIAERGDRVRAEPFTDLEIDLADLFGDPDE